MVESACTTWYPRSISSLQNQLLHVVIVSMSVASASSPGTARCITAVGVATPVTRVHRTISLAVSRRVNGVARPPRSQPLALHEVALPEGVDDQSAVNCACDRGESPRRAEVPMGLVGNHRDPSAGGSLNHAEEFCELADRLWVGGGPGGFESGCRDCRLPPSWVNRPGSDGGSTLVWRM
jgi:hypothetical protein